MVKGEVVFAKVGTDEWACSDESAFTVNMKLAKSNEGAKVLKRMNMVACNHTFVYRGDMTPDTEVDGVFRQVHGEKEDVRYFKGILLSLNAGVAAIRLTGDLIEDENFVKQFLNRVKEW